MKQLRRLATALLPLLAGAWLVLAEGPDDLFVRIYNLVQEADTLRANGQTQEAQSRYISAGTLLDKLQTSYPNWNEKIVSYRKRYITERLGPNAAALLAKPAPGAPAPAAPTAATAAGKSDDRLTALNEEVAALRAERENLQAKLREALNVQPAAVDPRELAKAEGQVKALRSENNALKANVAQQQARLAGAPDPAAFAEAQKAAREAKDALQRQERAVASLTKERDALKQQLKRATDKTAARAAKEEQKAAKPAPPAPAPVPAPPVDQAKTTDLESKLKQAQDALTAERKRSDLLLAEKAALEKHVTELASAKPSTAPAAVPAAAPSAAPTAPTPAPAAKPAPAPDVSSTPAKPAAATETKAEKKAEKAAVKQLTRERDELRKRVAVLNRELDDRRLRSGTGQQDRLAEELSILRTRIMVYESRQVPYSPEELALLKTTAGVNTQVDPAASKRSARQMPAGAATLVAEAQRAFQGRRLDEAEKKFQQALVLDDRNVGLLTDLAATHLEQGRLDAAESALKRAAAVDPNDPDVLSLLGLLRFRQGKYDEAMDILGRAVQLNPDNALSQNYLGVTLSQKGQRVPAETAFRKAIQIEPNYAEAHFNLAIVYAHAKPPSLELARWHYQKAIAGGQPRNPEIETLLGSGSGTTPAK